MVEVCCSTRLALLRLTLHLDDVLDCCVTRYEGINLIFILGGGYDDDSLIVVGDGIVALEVVAVAVGWGQVSFGSCEGGMKGVISFDE